jgi:cytoskeletal protein CcmA (bactofilin family)
MAYWNKKRDEDDLQRPDPPLTPASGVQRETLPTSTYPARRPEELMTRSSALIGKSLVLTGKISGREDLIIDGRIEGDIDLPENCLTVGAAGHVQGAIRAREIVIFGAVHGNMEAVEKVQIRRNARVIGDIRTARPVIEEEAYFKGNIETVRAEAPKAPPQRPQAAEGPQQPSLPNATPPAGETRRG